jgi:hypothetical protein
MVWRQIQGTMYIATQAQLDAEKRVNKQGFNFSNWIPHQPDANLNPVEGTEKMGVMVMVKRTHRFAKEYREIEVDGTIS